MQKPLNLGIVALAYDEIQPHDLQNKQKQLHQLNYRPICFILQLFGICFARRLSMFLSCLILTNERNFISTKKRKTMDAQV